MRGDNVYVVERDHQIGEAATLKKLYSVAASELEAAPLGSDLPLVGKVEAYDFLPDLSSSGGYVLDKLEGFTFDLAGNAYAVTDNDGVDDSNGETVFLKVDVQP